MQATIVPVYQLIFLIGGDGASSSSEAFNDEDDTNGFQLLNEVESGGTLSSLFTILRLFTCAARRLVISRKQSLTYYMIGKTSSCGMMRLNSCQLKANGVLQHDTLPTFPHFSSISAPRPDPPQKPRTVQAIGAVDDLADGREPLVSFGIPSLRKQL